MTRPKRVRMWECSICNTEYKDRDDAYYCFEECSMAEAVEELSMWACSECEECFYDKKDAKECCKEGAL